MSVTGTKTGVLSYTNNTNNNIDTNIMSDQEYTISPDTHYYEKQSNGTYKITLGIENLQLSNPTLLDNSLVYKYSYIKTPQMGASIDFTQGNGSSFSYNISNALLYANNINGDKSTMGIRWNKDKNQWEYYQNCNNNIGMLSGWNHFIPLQQPGDMYLITDDPEEDLQIGNTYFHFFYNQYSYVAGGTQKYFLDFSRSYWKTDIGGSRQCYPFEVYGFGSGTIPAIIGGITLPINNFLYWGASGNTAHKYQWQSNSSGTITTYDATEGVKNVTKDACKKLKTDFGSNLRIYLIKYRKQTQYKHKLTHEAQDFDYNYLNNCATGTSAPYMYDVSDETGLNSALSAIASDIKNWAGYESAKNVDMDE